MVSLIHCGWTGQIFVPYEDEDLPHLYSMRKLTFCFSISLRFDPMSAS